MHLVSAGLHMAMRRAAVPRAGRFAGLLKNSPGFAGGRPRADPLPGAHVICEAAGRWERVVVAAFLSGRHPDAGATPLAGCAPTPGPEDSRPGPTAWMSRC